MKYISAIALLLVATGLASAQQAQQQEMPAEYKLAITPQELGVIGQALMARPFSEVNGLIAKINAQIAEQQKAGAAKK